jgi:hypothetical protein
LLKLFWSEAVTWKQMVRPDEIPRPDSYRSILSLTFCIKKSPSCEPRQSPCILSLLVVASPWAAYGDVALQGKKSSFFFSRG